MHDEDKERAEEDPQITESKKWHALITIGISLGGCDLVFVKTFGTIELNVLEERHSRQVDVALRVIIVFFVKHFWGDGGEVIICKGCRWSDEREQEKRPREESSEACC